MTTQYGAERRPLPSFALIVTFGLIVACGSSPAGLLRSDSYRDRDEGFQALSSSEDLDQRAAVPALAALVAESYSGDRERALEALLALQFSDGRSGLDLALMDGASCPLVLRVSDGKILAHGRSKGGTFGDIVFSPDGRRIIVNALGHDLVVMQVSDGREVLRLPAHGAGHSASLQSAVFTPDGRRLVTSSLDDTIRVWDLSAR